MNIGTAPMNNDDARYDASNAATAPQAHRGECSGLRQIVLRLRDAFKVETPLGYEDESGFHYGVMPLRPEPVMIEASEWVSKPIR